MKIENHVDVYVDEKGRVCLAQPSMEEECGVTLEPEEVRGLIRLLTDALDEAGGMNEQRQPAPTVEEKSLLAT
jgi:hypothetical protein